MRRRTVLKTLTAACLAPAACTTAVVDGELVTAFAPTGRLQASINLGNPILASRDATGEPVGVSVDLARELARRLGLDVDLVVFDAAGKSVDAVTQDRADFGFFAIDPVRGAGVAFTSPYVLIEGAYLVRDDSPIRTNDEVDRGGIRVVVGRGSAYDLYLSRTLVQAELLRAATSPEVTDTFLRERADVAAGVRQQPEADARRLPGLRLLDGRFMVIAQAMGLSRSRGPAALAYLERFVEEMKASGFVARSLARHRIDGAVVAPAG